MHTTRVSTTMLLMTSVALAQAGEEGRAQAKYFVCDSLRGTLARDHASRLVHYRGRKNRSYMTYLDHYHDIMVTFYDHDDREWHNPVRVDRAPVRDGHAAPAVFVDSSGLVHTFSARGPLRHCRSRRPEDISEWEPVRLVGPQDKSLTYTYPMEIPGGDLLLFYRLGSAAGNSPLVVSRSSDRGSTWEPPRVLVDYGANQAKGTVKINDAIYNVQTKRVHLSIRERDNSQSRPKWYAHYCEYDPSGDQVFALNGANLGETATREELVGNGCRLSADADLALWAGRTYLLLRARTPILAALADGQLVQRPLPGLKGASQPTLFVGGESDWRIYGYRPCDMPTPYPTAGDLTLWRSEDAGKTWDAGCVLVSSAEIGHGLIGLNLARCAPTMGKAYSGQGPLILFQEAFSASYGKELRGPDGSTFSEMQLRFNKRIYALDGEHEFVERGTPFRFSGYWDDREGPVAGQAPGPRRTFQLR